MLILKYVARNIFKLWISKTNVLDIHLYISSIHNIALICFCSWMSKYPCTILVYSSFLLLLNVYYSSRLKFINTGILVLLQSPPLRGFRLGISLENKWGYFSRITGSNSQVDSSTSWFLHSTRIKGMILFLKICSFRSIVSIGCST